MQSYGMYPSHMQSDAIRWEVCQPCAIIWEVSDTQTNATACQQLVTSSLAYVLPPVGGLYTPEQAYRVGAGF
jgi:hypothetical protein